jgi:hypothetical protein
LILLATTVLAPKIRADFNQATGEWEGDVSAMTFKDYCRGDLPSERRESFFASLDVADSALASNNIPAALDAFGDARGAAYRGGGDSDVSIKCLGEPTAGRWFDAQLELTRQQAATYSPGSGSEFAGLYVLAVEQDSDAIIEAVGRMKPRRFAAAIGNLEQIVARIDNEREFGAFILGKEDRLATACRDAVISLRRRAAQEHRNALREEEGSFSRPLSAEILEASKSIKINADLAKAMIGVDVGAIWDRDVVVLGQRASQSQDLLRLARVWNLEIYVDRRTMPSSRRAQIRGDEMLSRAEETSSSLRLRDALYDEARRYYDFGGFDEASNSAKAAHESIEPALRAERDRQDRLLEDAEERMSEKAESVRRTVEDMTKTDAERKSFEEEADALEDELGF